ncbi:uncharacterized protein METZ01_LOCUS388368, partial [marine metagenome]
MPDMINTLRCLLRNRQVWLFCVLAMLQGCAATTTTTTGNTSKPASVDELIKAGNALVSRGDYDAAMTQYNRALAQDIASADAHGNFSVALYYAGRYNDAIREAQQAIVMAPTELNWRLNLGAA